MEVETGNAVTVATPAVAPSIPRDGAARAEWQKTGAFPSEKKEATSSNADSAPASVEAGEKKPAEKTASASEAESTQEQKSSHKRSNADTRLTEILDDLRKAGLTPAELKTFKREAQQAAKVAESQPAAAEKKTDSDAPKKPKVDDYETWEKYEEAHDTYVDELTAYKAKKVIAESKAQDARDKVESEMRETVNAARERYADYDEIIEPARVQIFDDKEVHPALKAMVDASPVFIDLLYVLGKKPADLDAIVQLSKTNPIEAIRKVVLLDQLVREEMSGKPKEEAKVPAKRVPTAQDPGFEASGTNATPSHPVAAAVKQGDVRKFFEEENKRDIARRKGR